MKGMVYRIVLVPIEDTEVTNSMETLPRILDDNANLGVEFKRMKDPKNLRVNGFLHSTKMYQALETFKVLGKSHCQTVIIKVILLPKTIQR